jgi:type VI protein secretion system component VasK
MAEQSFQNHAHRPTHTALAGLFALLALIFMVRTMFFGRDMRDWAILSAILAVWVLVAISRTYTVRLQDRIIMLEVKVRAAELLNARQDDQLATLSSKQIAALRFASDEEFGALLDRAVRENLSPKDIKAAIRNWRPDFYRT